MTAQALGGELGDWLASQLGVRPLRVRRLPRDAGSRTYTRIHVERGSFVLCTPGQWDESTGADWIPRFVSYGAVLEAAGIRVPGIIATHPVHGLLLTDLGRHQLRDLRTSDYFSPPWSEVFQAASRFASAMGDVQLPVSDMDHLMRELHTVSDWYAPARRLIPELVEDALTVVCRAVAEQPISPQHMDLHARNVVVNCDGNIGIVDFQDSMRGPAYLDFASLVFDQNFARDRNEVEQMIHSLHKTCRDYLPEFRSRESDFLESILHAGVYWCVRIIGICSRLAVRDGRPQYAREVYHSIEYLKIIQSLGISGTLRKSISILIAESRHGNS